MGRKLSKPELRAASEACMRIQDALHREPKPSTIVAVSAALAVAAAYADAVGVGLDEFVRMAASLYMASGAKDVPVEPGGEGA